MVILWKNRFIKSLKQHKSEATVVKNNCRPFWSAGLSFARSAA